MTERTNFSNFSFLQIINAPLFQLIQEAESYARTDFVACGHKSRNACDVFIDSVIRKKGLENEITGDLFTKISSLRDEELLKSIGFLAAEQNLSDTPILPELGTVDYLAESGKTIYKYDYYDFLRRFGNACSHPKKNRSDPKVVFSNVIKCLKGYRLLFIRYYSRQVPKNIEHFKEDLMPIDKYYITSSRIPDDQYRSKCEREFWGYTLNDRKQVSYYAILRLYNKDDVDRNFMLRNSDVFIEASRDTISGIPDGMTSFQTVVGLDNAASSFYITAHLFRYEPKPLNQKLLLNTTMKQRLELCYGIANCFYNLHNSEEPIYHRLLTYDSVVVCNIKNQMVPYVIKFDYGKFAQSDQYETVFQQTVQAEKKIQKEKSLIKYLAPEWINVTDTNTVDWEKIDIYSLGVLFSDILAGRFDGTIVSFDELEELNLSDDILDMIDMMTSENATLRCNIEYIQLVLQEELKSWS